MTDVPWLDVIGNYGGTNFEQLCLSFNSGSGGLDSCQNTVDAVSGLLFDAPIGGFIQIPMTALPVINDLVGGVSVFIEEDMTVVDPAFVQGATVRLKGGQAERFVRARMVLENDTNIARMNRQRIYMDGFQRAARAAVNSDSEFVMKVVEKLGEYMQTNLTGNQLIDLLEQLDTYEVAPIRVPEGELRIGEYYEFYVDEDSLWENVKELFCQ
jgi:anionic cell wall polymer biosynthesis LytR-Cps2A-Psr (LCP) family protein